MPLRAIPAAGLAALLAAAAPAAGQALNPEALLEKVKKAQE